MAVFELGGGLARELPALAIGPWARTLPANMAFAPAVDSPDLSSAPSPNESLWRVDLAGGADASGSALSDGEHSVAAIHAALDDLPRRLDLAVHHARSPAWAAASGQPADDALPRAESALAAALVDPGRGEPIGRAERAWRAEPRERSDIDGDDDRDPRRIEQSLARIGDLVRGRARIETWRAGELVARSVMTISGDTECWTARGLSQADAALHARSVIIAARTRSAWARVLVVVVRGCRRLLVLGLPSLSVAALPLIWRFVRDVLREYRRLRAGRGVAPAAG
jgi:hypothetical protein